MTPDIQQIKQRFGIIGHNPLLNRALEIAKQVAPTDMSVLVTGESGSGKEVMPQIIHQFSHRKHNPYIAVNCGAIPEGTIDSELFGHEKGSFTGATDSRKGYFEEANGGSIFLDEVAELPLQTQVRLLRVLETGEYLRVGSSKVHKTDVRIIAATNVNMEQAVKNGSFREDLFYRLNSVPIEIPPLRKRGEDIYLLFRKFSADFADKYKMPPVQLTEDAKEILMRYSWPGNIRQLKNVTEQISILEPTREVDSQTMTKYLPPAFKKQVPVVYKDEKKNQESFSEREILYKVLFDLKNELSELKQLVMRGNMTGNQDYSGAGAVSYYDNSSYETSDQLNPPPPLQLPPKKSEDFDIHEEVEENYSIAETEKDLIKKALAKHNNKRKSAAKELGISERTLYRKIKEYDLN
ncbi:sigma-54 interaction domain-containing protein [Luteibaculum oceani]|uniref:Sigma-54-dependent Fis family transcriptional regulator n=1 Tax=Luteibaculum oceani TaxID=1294296 RepID=A0A5C6V038_9FLAO|nr:sigma-54 dependent transcriptional regulator [Luteibaculum oceani]TXC78857.1 sigma-54-dependent Fis family transcriptional regulator [Luteibaculum oceani]